MFKYSFFLLLLIVLSSCSLNSTQEQSLNSAKVSYINSKNNGSVMSYVAYTLPEAVAYYKSKGDSVFQKRFDLSKEQLSEFIQDGNISKVVNESPIIHVKFNFISNNITDGESEVIYAISENDGSSWFFAEEVDYKNDKIISEIKQLIKGE